MSTNFGIEQSSYTVGCQKVVAKCAKSIPESLPTASPFMSNRVLVLDVLSDRISQEATERGLEERMLGVRGTCKQDSTLYNYCSDSRTSLLDLSCLQHQIHDEAHNNGLHSIRSNIRIFNIRGRMASNMLALRRFKPPLNQPFLRNKITSTLPKVQMCMLLLDPSNPTKQCTHFYLHKIGNELRSINSYLLCCLPLMTPH